MPPADESATGVGDAACVGEGDWLAEACVLGATVGLVVTVGAEWVGLGEAWWVGTADGRALAVAGGGVCRGVLLARAAPTSAALSTGPTASPPTAFRTTSKVPLASTADASRAPPHPAMSRPRFTRESSLIARSKDAKAW